MWPLGIFDFEHFAIDAHADEPLALEIGEQTLWVGEFFFWHRGKQRDLAALRECGECLHDVGGAHALEGDAGLRVVRDAGGGPEDAEVIVDLGGGGEGRARVESAAALFDRDGGAETFDRIDIRFFQLIEKLARVGRERLHIAALSFRVERVEGERGFA